MTLPKSDARKEYERRQEVRARARQAAQDSERYTGRRDTTPLEDAEAAVRQAEQKIASRDAARRLTRRSSR